MKNTQKTPGASSGAAIATPNNVLRLACALLLAALYAAFVLAAPAHAQAGGEIVGFVESIRDFLIQLVVPIGTIGLIVCGILKQFAASNSRLHEAAGYGIRGCFVGTVLALGATIIMTTVEGFIPAATIVLHFGS